MPRSLPTLIIAAHVLLPALGFGLYTLAPPIAREGWARLEAAMASDAVAEAMEEARRLSEARRMPVRVTIDTANRSLDVDGGKWRKLPDGIALAGPPPGRDGRAAIIFYPDGSSSGGQVVVAAPGHAVSLLVDWENGRVRKFKAQAG